MSPGVLMSTVVDHHRGRIWRGSDSEDEAVALVAIDGVTGEEFPQPDYTGARPFGVSHDGRLLAVGTPTVARGTRKTDLVVLDLDTGREVLRTRRWLVHDVAFAPDGEHALIEAWNTKPRRYRLGTDLVDSEQDLGPLPVDFRHYEGDRDPVTGHWLNPSERARGRIERVDISSGDVEQVRLPAGRITRLRFDPSGDRVVVLTVDGLLVGYDRLWNEIWRVDATTFPTVSAQQWHNELLISRRGGLVCLANIRTTGNDWGVDQVLNLADGSLVRRIESYRGRGQVIAAHSGTRMLLYGMSTLDLATGEIMNSPGDVHQVTS